MSVDALTARRPTKSLYYATRKPPDPSCFRSFLTIFTEPFFRRCLLIPIVLLRVSIISYKKLPKVFVRILIWLSLIYILQHVSTYIRVSRLSRLNTIGSRLSLLNTIGSRLMICISLTTLTMCISLRTFNRLRIIISGSIALALVSIAVAKTIILSHTLLAVMTSVHTWIAVLRVSIPVVIIFIIIIIFITIKIMRSIVSLPMMVVIAILSTRSSSISFFR